MKYIVALIIALAISKTSGAQLQFDLMQNYSIPYALNPSFSGVENFMDIKFGTRQQWTKLQEGPKTNYAGLNLHTDLLRKRTKVYEDHPGTFSGVAKKGISLFAMQDAYGPYSSITLSTAYAYHLPVTHYHYLSTGITTEYQSGRYNSSKLIPRDMDDPLYQSLLNNQPSQQKFNMHAGVAFYGRRFYIGYSHFNLVTRNFQESSLITNNRFQSIQAGINLNLNYSTKIYLTSIVRRQNNDTPVIDASAKIRYSEKIWLGYTYRNTGGMAGLMGMNFNKFFVHYSYQFRGSNPALGSIHELALGIVSLDFLNNKAHSLKPYFL